MAKRTGKERTMFEIIDEAPQEGAIIKVIGVGGCGGNAVEHMIIRGLSGVEFISAGMGGGTGTGAAPVIADIAKSMSILTVAVVTRPFAFEGKRQRVAQTGIEELGKKVDSLIVIPNDKLMQVLGEEVSVLDAYASANDVLHGAVAGIAEVINNAGLVNVDFADVRTV